jgi:hypothetical protein
MESDRAYNSRRFYLHRIVDHSGISGTGIVADGIQWPDASVTLCWRGDCSSIAHWRNAEHMLTVHGHNGATVIKWID